MKTEEEKFLDYVKEAYDPEIYLNVRKRIKKIENPNKKEMDKVLREERNKYRNKIQGGVTNLKGFRSRNIY